MLLGTRQADSTHRSTLLRYFHIMRYLKRCYRKTLFVLVLLRYRTRIAPCAAKWGIAQMYLCETKCQGRVSHQFGGVLSSLKKVSRDMGYRNDSIARSRDMGPLSFQRGVLFHVRGGGGVKKFGMFTEARENKLFGGIPQNSGCPKSSEPKDRAQILAPEC